MKEIQFFFLSKVVIDKVDSIFVRRMNSPKLSFPGASSVFNQIANVKAAHETIQEHDPGNDDGQQRDCDDLLDGVDAVEMIELLFY